MVLYNGSKRWSGLSQNQARQDGRAFNVATTRDAIAYLAIAAKTPRPILHLTTLLYMSDWKSAITNKRQISQIQWVQPFVAKIAEVAQVVIENPRDFALDHKDPFAVSFTGDPRSINISGEERTCLDFVLHSESQRGWPELFRLAYSTFPIFSQPAGALLDLVALSELYERAQLQKVAG